MALDRRQWLIGAGALGAAAAAGLAPRISFAAAETDQRLVVVMLRGAMDGLSAAPAYGDPDYQRARTGLAIPPPGAAGGALPLDSTFALNPALPLLSARYAAKEAMLFHAIASPYRDRSHFDGQNLLENGSTAPYGLADGWLNRALAGLPGAARAGRSELGIALAPAMPLMLRGTSPVTSWSPSILPGPNADFVARVGRLYAATDPKLDGALSAAAQANAAAGGMDRPGAGDDAFVNLMGAAAKFLAEPNGPRVAMADSAGWDTHAGETGAYNVLSRNLAGLDKGLDALRTGLGDHWSQTAVLVMTEFGRTVAMNGTDGSDHGTASAAFLVGGAVAGGRVHADWPGLKPAALYAGRDLMPTADLRQIAKAALRDHMGVDPGHIDRVVFPDSQRAPAFEGLFRTA
jgi:uncharacterized protein (DUF1501 family)